MSGQLEGKVAIVTGGASGIGRASVKRFAKEGARVVIADISEHGEAYARELGEAVAFIKTDVARADDVEAAVAFAVKRFGTLDVMFANAGISGAMHRVSLLDETFDDFERVMQVDLLGVMLCTKFAARHMAETKQGAVLVTASIGGMVGGYGIPSYRAAKAGVLNFMRVAAIELGSHNIRVNAISPGPIETPILAGGVDLPEAKAAQLHRDLMDAMTVSQPLKRYGQPEDIADAAVFLASDRAAQITGHNLIVDGGMNAGETSNRMAAMAAIHARAMSE